MRRPFLWLLLALAGASPAAAHPAPFSYIDVRVPGAAVDLTIVAHIFDLAHDLGLEDANVLLDARTLESHRGAITHLLAPRLQLWTDGPRSGDRSGPLSRRWPIARGFNCRCTTRSARRRPV